MWGDFICDYESMQASEVEQPASVRVQALHQPFMKKTLCFSNDASGFHHLSDYHLTDERIGVLRQNA